MSLDGYVSGPQENAEESVALLFKWMTSGGTDITLSKGDGDIELQVPEKSKHVFEDAQTGIGALVSGRRLFEMTHGWGGRHPIGAPIVVVSHREPPEWAKEWPNIFTNNLGTALEKAREIAGHKNVAVASTTLVQQCLKAGWLDEIHVDLVPVLLGAGVRLFDQLDAPIELESTEVIASTGVTHLTFRVLK